MYKLMVGVKEDERIPQWVGVFLHSTSWHTWLNFLSCFASAVCYQ